MADLEPEFMIPRSFAISSRRHELDSGRRFTQITGQPPFIDNTQNPRIILPFLLI